MRPTAILLVLGTLAASGCTPDWAKQGDSPMLLLITGLGEGVPVQSDVRISTGGICPDFVAVRVENHHKNPLAAQSPSGFRGDIVLERYDVRYYRSDGRATEGVDVPFAISGNVSHEIQEGSSAVLNLEVVRRQAKLEPPLRNLASVQGAGGGGALVVTMFAEITLHARSTINQTTNSATGRVQIDFADFGDTLTACPVQ